jgi:hypothetical protein
VKEKLGLTRLLALFLRETRRRNGKSRSLLAAPIRSEGGLSRRSDLPRQSETTTGV